MKPLICHCEYCQTGKRSYKWITSARIKHGRRFNKQQLKQSNYDKLTTKVWVACDEQGNL